MKRQAPRNCESLHEPILYTKTLKAKTDKTEKRIKLATEKKLEIPKIEKKQSVMEKTLSMMGEFTVILHNRVCYYMVVKGCQPKA